MGDQSFSTLRRFQSAVSSTQVFFPSAQQTNLEDGLGLLIGWLGEIRANDGRCYIVGNGGSHSIATHIANDLWKTRSIPAHSFDDGSLLTCAANDFGFDQVYAAPLKRFGRKNDMLIAISSSGNSANILNAVNTAREMGMRTVTLSGFESSNHLHQLGELNFYVPEKSYGIVETAHLLLLHTVVDELEVK